MCTFKKILPLLTLLLLCSCIKNDLPYPQIAVKFTAFMAEGESSPAVIDPETRTVTLTMGEEADLRSVSILSYKIDPAEAKAANLGATLDLTSTHYVTLSLYQDYVWAIRATQPIERYFALATQIGEPVIDAPGHRVIAYVPKGTDLTALKVTAIKLGSTAATMKPDLNGHTVDMSRPVEVTVTDHGQESRWTIYVEAVDASVSLTQVDAWSRVAWLYANAEEGKDNGFEYRVEGTEEWTRVPAAYITSANGSLSARLPHLSPATTYEVRAYSDTDVTAPERFTTGTEPQLPNADFNEWWLDGKVWNPWAEGGQAYWDTGNKGSTTLGTSNTLPTASTPSGTGYAAELRSEFKGIGSIGKLAAGSIFTGVYVRTDGTNGILNFGRQFTERPTRLTGMMKYKSSPISNIGSDAEYADWKGRPDTAQIYIALADWTEPFEVRTNPRTRRLFDPSAPEVIAYGTVAYGESVDSWTPFSIDLNYRSTARKPRYILVVCSASKYGDFFVGGNGSVLEVDDLTLEYDY